MVKFRFVWISLCVGLSDTFCYDLSITFLVASVLAIRTLHSCSVFKELSTKCATHNVVKLLLHELVTILFVDFFFLLTNSSFSAET